MFLNQKRLKRILKEFTKQLLKQPNQTDYPIQERFLLELQILDNYTYKKFKDVQNFIRNERLIHIISALLCPTFINFLLNFILDLVNKDNSFKRV